MFLSKGNVKLLCDFIIDNPYETQSDIVLTYKFISRLHKGILLDIFALSFFPGSHLYDQALKDKIILEGDDLTARSYSSRLIKYQINYPMLLLLCWESMFFTRRFPKWMILFPVSKPVRMVMKIIPRWIMRWAIHNLPDFLRWFVNKFISMNKKSRVRLQTVSKSSY